LNPSPNDLQAVVNIITARVTALDRVKSGLEQALRKADADLSAILGGAAELPPPRGRGRRSNGAAVLPTGSDTAGGDELDLRQP
jgi:hypothetical protein